MFWLYGFKMSYRISFLSALVLTLNVAGQPTYIDTIEVKNESPLVLPSIYFTNGTKYLPLLDIVEPFAAWYDKESGKSRIDYHNGIVKTFQQNNEKYQYGLLRKIIPTTVGPAQKYSNKNTCLAVKGKENNTIEIQSIIPESTKGYKLQGIEIIREMKTNKWFFEEITEQKYIKKHFLYTRYQKSEGDNLSISIPIRYERIVLYYLSESIREHYWFDYDYFSSKKIGPSIFEIKKMNCTFEDNSEIDYLYTFNPMRELINGQDDCLDDTFEKFKRVHNRNYTGTEHHLRKKIFTDNLRFIHFKNRANLGFTLKVNFFADRKPEELDVLRGYKPGRLSTYKRSQPLPYNIQQELKTLPENFDWRIRGAVTSVKDQGDCGSCWSFAAVGAVESEFFVHSNKIIRHLSEQALLDCSWEYGNSGCMHGFIEKSFHWILRNGGIPTEEEYGQYENQEDYCRVENSTLAVRITGYGNLIGLGEDVIKVVLFKHGPLAVYMNDSPSTFKFYSFGVYKDTECSGSYHALNHAVLLVGYGELNGEKYWLIKNSWSQNWGNAGYALIAIENNICGIMNNPGYVTF